jgi:hypothetical protein
MIFAAERYAVFVPINNNQFLSPLKDVIKTNGKGLTYADS